MDPGRRAHYRDFYGDNFYGEDLDVIPAAYVHGNCQAEALRVLLAGRLPGLQAVRAPPVHELTAADLPHLERLLARTRLVVAQPVKDGYRGLPLGTAEVARRTPAELVVVPVLRVGTLHPYQAIVRDPTDTSRNPPLVPYHDLRTLALAAGRTPGPVDPARLVEVGRATVLELARRERRTDVGVSDVVEGLGTGAAWTLNHPGNPLLRVLATRVLERLGLSGVVEDPGRELLGGVRAPLQAEVLSALGLPDPPREHWLLDGEPLDDALVRHTQTAWYAEHPAVVTAGLDRYATTMELLGLGR